MGGDVGARRWLAIVLALTFLAGPVSTVGAHRLLEHFGSLQAVFAADRAQLLEVPGIGPKRAAVLHRLFRHRASRDAELPRAA